MMIRIGSKMAVVTVMLSACSQLAVEVEETAAPTESAVIIVTVEATPTSAEPSPTPGKNPLPYTDTIKEVPGDPNAPPNEWTFFTFEGADEYELGFVLYYPRSWGLSVWIRTYESKYGGREMVIALEKQEFWIGIYHGYIDELLYCLYPEEPKPDNLLWTLGYGEYVEIEKEGGIMWRRARNNNISSSRIMSFSVCELGPQGKYADMITNIGQISISGPTLDEVILSEFDEILRRIEFLD